MYSKISIIFILILQLICLHYFGNWHLNAGGGDSWGYYGYLPATFIHHDLGTLEKSIATRTKYSKHQDFIDNGNPLRIDEAKHLGEGRQVMKYSMGISILIAPFFLIAHFLALLFDLPADGYSSIYLYFANHACLFYVFFGFLFLRKVLLEYFTDAVTAITLIGLGLGTNLFFFTTYNPTMSHPYLFGLYCLLIYSTIEFYKNPKYKWTFLIGLSCGLIALSRPVEIICLIIPLFYGITNKNDLFKRIDFFKKEWKKILLSIIIYSGIGTIQMMYWKWATGSWIYYSYEDEGFDFSNPHFIEGVFGFQNGWLPYTPIMICALLGILFLWKKRDFLLSVILYLPLHIYIIYSWWCWNYINGFGSRPMIEAYPLLSIPLASFVAFALKKNWSKFLFFLFFIFCIFLNGTHTYQFQKGLIYTEHGHKKFYLQTLGKFNFSYNDYVVNDIREYQPKENKLIKIQEILFEGFNDTLDHINYVCEDTSLCADTLFYFNNKTEVTKKIKTTYDKINFQPGDYIKVSAKIKTTANPNSTWDMAHLVCQIEGPDVNVWKGIKLENKIGGPPYGFWTGKPNVWDEMHFFTQAPTTDQPKETTISIYVWQPRERFIYVNDMKAEIFRKK